MGDKSTIEWTQATWNPVTGCTKISAGCANCYAERMTRRLKAMGQPNYRDGFAVRTHEHMLELPLTWKQPREVFVNSMSDLFHEDVPFGFIERVFDVMREAHQHTYQVLTKRSARLRELAPHLDWPANLWMGVSVENARAMRRIDDLRAANGPVVRFLSCEPLLEALPNFDLSDIDWVIVGGESGPSARPMDEEWVLSVRDACRDAVVPFFFKQWGGVRKKKAGRMLEGRSWSELPAIVATRATIDLEAAV
jgi:protein gp37